MLLKKSKVKTFLKSSNLYKVDYKIQDTDGFHKIHVPLQGFSALIYSTVSASWEPHSNKLHRAPWWLVSLSNKSNRPSFPSLLGQCTDIRLTHGKNSLRKQSRVYTIH